VITDTLFTAVKPADLTNPDGGDVVAFDGTTKKDLKYWVKDVGGNQCK
jgi:hypothetical protein